VVLQPGLVSYKENSDREIITRIEIREADPDQHCEAAWIGFSEIYPDGTPYSFHLQRKHLKTIREDGCGDSPSRFLSRTKTYRFELDADSQRTRDIGPVAQSSDDPAASGAGEESNDNLWNAISTETPPEPSRKSEPATRNASAPEFARTAWVVARTDIKAHYVALVRGVDQRETIIALNKTHVIPAGELGQIEASNGRTAIVRFYAGSRIERFARKKNAFRRWYDDAGGPYLETKDDLYSPLRACILEVRLEDIIEINDYLDEQNTDRT
jgi:hypothetical protein